jgi:hypothetical protein
MILVQRESQLVQSVQALRSRRTLAHPLNCRKKKPNQHPDDRNDHDQFQERVCSTI